MTIPPMDSSEFWMLLVVAALLLYGGIHLTLSVAILALGGNRR